MSRPGQTQRVRPLLGSCGLMTSLCHTACVCAPRAGACHNSDFEQRQVCGKANTQKSSWGARIGQAHPSSPEDLWLARGSPF